MSNNKLSKTEKDISKFNSIEQKWICDFYRACCEGVSFTETPPSTAAKEYVIEYMESMGY